MNRGESQVGFNGHGRMERSDPWNISSCQIIYLRFHFERIQRERIFLRHDSLAYITLHLLRSYNIRLTARFNGFIEIHLEISASREYLRITNNKCTK